MNAKDTHKVFDSISIKIASTSDIKIWAKRTACKQRGTEGATWPCPEIGTCDCGEVKKGETLNYRTLRPRPEGLFCEAIFGPQKNFECACGKYKRIKHKGVVCEECGVEVAHSRVRRERFGYIQLVSPVAHIWFVNRFPSPISTLCELSSHQLEQVLYFEAFIVLEVTDPGCPLEPRQVLTGIEYEAAQQQYPKQFRAGIGAEAIAEILRGINLELERDKFKAALLMTSSKQKKRKLTKQLKQVENFVKSKQRPESMIMNVIHVIPPDLYPLVPFNGAYFTTKDLNTLYRRVINRNNRLRALIQRRSPEVILQNEKRMLQEAVDSLFDNQHSRTRAKGRDNRMLKPLSQIISGKKGRFRQDLLEKRVNYSGCSGIVAEPELGLNQCGLPKWMAVELFNPFIIKKLQDRNHVQTLKRAKELTRQVDADSPVWKVLEEVINEHPILLNRQPALHRLGIQAFMPVLIEEQAIKLPPLVCKALNLNADFDSDEIIVHVPITTEAQTEATLLMLPSHNIRKPANGEPIVMPQRDMILGLNFLTKALPAHISEANILHHAYTHQKFETIHGKPWYLRRYANLHEVALAYEWGKLKLHDSIQLFFPNEQEPILTTVGRVIFNQILPQGLECTDEHTGIRASFFNDEITLHKLATLVERCLNESGTRTTVSFLESLQKLGFQYATRSGISPSIKDYIMPADKQTALTQAKEQIATLESEVAPGEELDEALRRIWYNAVDAIENALFTELAQAKIFSVERNEQLKGLNPVHIMAESGACSEKNPFTQISAIVGLKTNQNGEIGTTPIDVSYRKGLEAFDSFKAACSARNIHVNRVKSIRAAEHLARRLVNVALDVLIKEVDCSTRKGIKKFATEGANLAFKIRGRTAAQGIIHPTTQKVLVDTGSLITPQAAAIIEAVNITEVRVRSVLTCETEHGICAKCYGTDLTNGRLVNVGEAIGIIAAQSIGELSVQALVKPQHVHAETNLDIMAGIPRLIELFEASKKKKEDTANPHHILKARSTIINGVHIKGEEAAWTYLVDEVQKVYSPGTLNDKHIEVIVRQMSRKIRITVPGDTRFSLDEEIEKILFHRENQKIYKNSGAPAKGEPILQGITRAALNTESFLSAAFFRQPKKVLTDAAMQGKKDPLSGLRENVMSGKLIPAGTGFKAYR